MTASPAKETITRESLTKIAAISLHAEHEVHAPDFGDAQTMAWIRAQTDNGNVWAWCVVTVTAEYEGCTGMAILGGCSYESRKALEESCLADMTSEAIDDLWRQLELRTPAGRAKALASAARQAITTSFRGPTDRNGSRVIARCEAKRISVPWDHALDASANHAAAALSLMDRLGWSERNELVMGGTREGFVFVQIPRRNIGERSNQTKRGSHGLTG